MRYAIRSLKYLFTLVFVFALVMFFMNFAGSVKLTPEEQMALFMANNGALKIALLIVLAAIYPMFGYIKRDVEGDIVKYKAQILVAMEGSGFSLQEEHDGEMIFKANTIFRRVAFLFEDEVKVSQRGEYIHIEGIRRGVAYATYRLDGMIANCKRMENEQAE